MMCKLYGELWRARAPTPVFSAPSIARLLVLAKTNRFGCASLNLFALNQDKQPYMHATKLVCYSQLVVSKLSDFFNVATYIAH